MTATEAKRREVLQLLREYRTWHTPYGGAAEINLESQGEYGPAGMIQVGAEYEIVDRRLLAESYEALEVCLQILRRDDLTLWTGLSSPYLQDPPDPSLVTDWRKKAMQPGGFWSEEMLSRHDRAVSRLAKMLKDVDLYVVWPKRMSGMKEKQIEARNDELFALYKQFRYSDGMSRNKSIEKASEHCGYARSRGYEIVDLREKQTG